MCENNRLIDKEQVQWRRRTGQIWGAGILAALLVFCQAVAMLAWPCLFKSTIKAAGSEEADSYLDPSSFLVYAAGLPMRGSAAEIQMFWNREKNTWFQSWSGAARIQGKPLGKYYMWCLDFGLSGMDEIDLPRQNWQSILNNNEAVAAGLVYIATHGYPNRIPAGMPKEKADAATQIAIWQYLEDLKISPGGGSNHLYTTGQVKYFKNIVDPPADVQATAEQKKPGRYWVDELVAGAKRTKKFKSGEIRLEWLSDWQAEADGRVSCQVRPVGDFDDWAVQPKKDFDFDRQRGKPGDKIKITVEAAKLARLQPAERVLEFKSYVDFSPANFGWYPSVKGPNVKVQSYLMVAEGARYAAGATRLQLEPATTDLIFQKADIADRLTSAAGSSGGLTRPLGGLAGAVYGLRYVGPPGFEPDREASVPEGSIFFYQGRRYDPGALILEVETGQDGKGKLPDLPPGRYDLLELSAPDGYTLNQTAVRFDLTAEGVKAIQRAPLPQTDNAGALLDELNAAVDRLNKRAEAMGGSRRQPHFSLLPEFEEKGAQKPSADIHLKTFERPALGYVEIQKSIEQDPDGWNQDLSIPDEGIAFVIKDQQGQLVDRIQTNSRGWGISRLLPLGSYQLAEVTRLDGLSIADPVNFTLSEDGAVQQFDLVNQAVKSRLKLVKVDRETGGRLPVAGVRFRFYREKEGGQALRIGDQDSFVTDEQGELLLPKELFGRGTYYIEEVEAPTGYYLAEGADRTPFTLSGQGQIEETVNLLVKEIPNSPQKGRVSLVKTGDVLHGWAVDRYNESFDLVRTDRLKALPTEAAVEAETVLDSRPVDQVAATGQERVEQESSPAGSGAVAGSVQQRANTATGEQSDKQTEDQMAGEKSAKTTIDEQSKEMAVGEEEESTAERPRSAEASAKSGFSVYRPLWTKGPLGGVEFNLIAETDIYSPSVRAPSVSSGSEETGGQGDPILLHRAGEVVAHLTTDESGRATSPELPLGRYRLEEVKLPEGYVQAEPVCIDLKADQQTVRVVDEAAHIYNRRQHFSVALTKKFEAAPPFDYEKEACAQTYFGLVNKRDIKVGGQLLPAGSILGLTRPDADGKVSFSADLAGLYEIKELGHHPAYLPVGDIEVEVAYVPGSTPAVHTEIVAPVVNQIRRGSLELVKVDVEQGKVLADASFRLIAVKGEEEVDLGLFSTDEKGKLIIQDLAYGHYYLTEVKAPAGYVRNKTPFSIFIDGVKQFQMKLANRQNRLAFVKTDLVTGTRLAGAEIELYDAAGTMLYHGVTDEDGLWVLRGLPAGNYTYIEKKAPAGYELDPNRYTLTIDADGLPDREEYLIQNKKYPIGSVSEPPLTRAVKPLPRTGERLGHQGMVGLFFLGGVGLTTILLKARNGCKKEVD